MSESEPKIDFTKIVFPSDKVTVKMVRQAWPGAIDVDRSEPLGRAPHRVYLRHSLDNVLGDDLIDPERMLAERAFKVARGQSVTNDQRISNKNELIDTVAHSYVRYGLARGKNEAKAMIRQIELQAEAQARQYPGRPRR
jgi:hypothetical protein